jgi:hypothetical protein
MASWLDTVTAPLKTAGEMASQFVEVRDAIKFGEIQAKLQKETLAAYEAVMKMREREATLIEENAALKRRVAELETRNAQLDKYELKKLPPGVFVRALKQDAQSVGPDHYPCERCYGEGKIAPLNSILVHNGIERLRCSVCNTDVNTGYPVSSSPARANTAYDIFTGR